MDVTVSNASQTWEYKQKNICSKNGAEKNYHKKQKRGWGYSRKKNCMKNRAGQKILEKMKTN